MPSFNQVIMLGNVCNEPEIKELRNNHRICTVTLAMNYKYGEHEETCFIDATFWNKQAETIFKYVQKGSPLLVEGRLRQETWETEDGKKRSKHVIAPTGFQLIPTGKRGAKSEEEPPVPDIADPFADQPNVKAPF